MASTLRPVLGLLLLLAGCGAPAIVDASRSIASSRGCEAAELTLTEGAGGYAASGCGSEGFYACTGADCADAEGQADTSWVAEAERALAELDAEILACNAGMPFTLQLRIDRDGKAQGLASEPRLGADQRVCVARIVHDHVELSSFEGGERLIAHRVGGPVSVTEAAPAEPWVSVDEEPAAEEPVEDEAPAEEPVEGTEDTSLPNELVE